MLFYKLIIQSCWDFFYFLALKLTFLLCAYNASIDEFLFSMELTPDFEGDEATLSGSFSIYYIAGLGFSLLIALLNRFLFFFLP